MNNLARSIESIGPSDTAEEIKSLIAVFNGYLNAMPDQELQQQLRNVTEIWVADAYVQLPITNAEHSAVRQQLLGFITDESLLTLIQKAFGGDEQSIGELERLKENADDQASIYYSIWVDGEDGVGTYVHVTYGPLRIGSDDDMIEINRLATEYIATNP